MIGPVRIGPTLVSVLGLLAIVWLLMLGFALLRDARTRAQEADQQNLRNQAAIRRLLDEMVDLSDGDLTIEATVTEDITGIRNPRVALLNIGHEVTNVSAPTCRAWANLRSANLSPLGVSIQMRPPPPPQHRLSWRESGISNNSRPGRRFKTSLGAS